MLARHQWMIAILFFAIPCAETLAAPLTAEQRQKFEQGLKELQTRPASKFVLDDDDWADVDVFGKGLGWALRYDTEFNAADIKLLENAVLRAKERSAALADGKQSWRGRPGRFVLGYRSRVDGSVQPFGIVVPKGYSAQGSPMRLDVVLHGSTRPVGMSELKFMSRFDQGDEPSAAPPDVPYIEVHPLGRVENCYRWAGETDVFEAIRAVCDRYNIDRHKLVLRGMSMGASGTWHLGLKHPDRFRALGPYCGYVDTHRFSETPLPNFVKVGALPEHQERTLHMLDSVDYAANAGVVPCIAAMGEKDIFFDAHVIMGDAMKREGLTMINLISPGTGHVIDPKTHAEQMRQIAEHVDKPWQPPSELRFVTWTLKYGKCHWLQLRKLDRHYDRAEIKAKVDAKQGILIDEPKNIAQFEIVGEVPHSPKKIRIGSTQLGMPTQRPAVFVRIDRKWQVDESPFVEKGKQPGLQGPIDDAFTSPFLCVRGTGKPWNEAVQKYADASLRRFAEEWRHYFRGELPIKNDTEVTDEDIKTRNLILFGDPGSNAWIAEVLPQLPLKWTKESLGLGGSVVSSADHVPALIAPNPLREADHRYVVLNSGHTFREAELAKVNYLLFPRWGDWAVLKVDPKVLGDQRDNKWEDSVLRAGFFGENWKFSETVNKQ